MKHRWAAFLVLAAFCGVSITLSIVLAMCDLHRRSTPSHPTAQSPETGTFPSSAAARSDDKQTTRVSPAEETIERQEKTGRSGNTKPLPALLFYFRANAFGHNFGQLAVVSTDAMDKVQYSAELRCNRVHFAGGIGVCLSLEKTGPNFAISSATGFDQSMKKRWTTRLMGLPSRVRVSPSGRLAAVTLFRFGESYASLKFSTQTEILDTRTGEVLADLEQFSVTRDRREFKSPDFNFWGVTFTGTGNENIFYATLWSKNRTYLVKTDLERHTATVIHDSVECPSLSPDGMRIAFKKRIGTNDVAWRLTMLDLRDGLERSLGESRSVDDQVEWLDNNHVLYGLSSGNVLLGASADIWLLSTETNAAPQLFLKGAFSPAVFRSQELVSTTGWSSPRDSIAPTPRGGRN
jgi:hypothetical protein